jgi:hypothetical protein
VRIGEIIQTASMAFVAESFALNRPPALGSLVFVEEADGRRLYGIVCHGQTLPMEPGRTPVRRSAEGRYDGDVYREHPELEHLLRTEFTASLVGWTEGGRIVQGLPAFPPPLHYSVHACEDADVLSFSDRLLYLRLLAAARGEVPSELVIAANLRLTYAARGNDRPWLESAAREVAMLLNQESDRLMAVLATVDPDEN